LIENFTIAGRENPPTDILPYCGEIQGSHHLPHPPKKAKIK